MNERLLKLPEVKRMTGRSEASIYRDMESGTFPRPVKIGRWVGWRESLIQAWIFEQIARSEPAA